MLFLVCSVSFVYSLLIEMPFLAVDKFLMSLIIRIIQPNKNKNKITIQTENQSEMPTIEDYKNNKTIF
jgi:hypothetical protein